MGKLIVLEGLDGSGKNTHSRRLSEKLTEFFPLVRKISFPDYEEPSSALVRMYLAGEFGTEPGDVNAYAASGFYALDRYASYKKHWQKIYEAGGIIVADRYTTSNATHQMGKLPREQWDGFLDWLCDYEYGLLGLPKPDLTLYLDMDPMISQRLIEKRYHGDDSRKDIHEKDVSYLLSCRESALYAAGRLGWRVIRLYDENGAFSKDENFAKVWAAAKEVLDGIS